MIRLSTCRTPHSPFWVSFFLIILLVFGSYTHAAQPPLLSAAEIDYPPFSMIDEAGRANGFSVALMTAALKAMDRDVTFRTGSWPEVRSWLESGEIQALPLVGRTPERELLFDFTFPYMSLHGAIVVRAGTTDIGSLKDLRGRQVAVMQGDNAEEFLRREDRGIEIVTTPTFETALQDLSEGRADAVVIQRLVGLRLIQETGLKNLQIITRPIEGFQQDFCFAVKEGDREILSLLNEGLSIVMADGTFRYLHAKWFAALELPATRRIIVGGDHNFPPYEYIDENGRPAGYNVDLTRAIAHETGLDIEIRLKPWSEIRKALETGEVDVIQGMFYSPERDLKFDFTQAHSVNHCVSVVRTGEGPPPATIDELTGKRIVVQNDDIMHDFALKNGLGANVSAVDAQEDALRELVGGSHDCALVSRMTALYWIDKNGWDHLTVGRHPLISPEYCYAVKNNHKALLSQFSEGLKLLEESGEYRRIHERWMGVYETALPDLKTILGYIAMAAVPLIFILSGVFLWSWSLRKQVYSRTAALIDSEKQYRLLADNTLDVIWTMTPDLVFTYINPACREIIGYTPEELIGTRLSALCDKENYARLVKRFAEKMTQTPKDSGVYVEAILSKKNGQPIPVEIHGKVIHGDTGQPVLVQGVMRDISERRRAEESLRESEKRFRLLYEQSPGPYHSLDTDGRIVEINNAWLATLGYERHEVIGRWFGDFLTSESRKLFTERFPRFKILGEVHGVEFDMIRKDGAVIIVSIDGRIGYDVNGEFSQTHCVLTDITERKRAEEEKEKLEAQLIQAQKMESVGRLAGGVAHDYNNTLSVILGYTELAMETVGPDNPLFDDLSEILQAANRSTEITRQLLAFARKQPISPKTLDLNETVEGMLKMLRRLIGEDIDLTWQPGTRLQPVKMDPSQLGQLLANLCVNARDAITDVGKIIIETDTVTLNDEFCADNSGFIPGDYIVLSVSDNGNGMDKEVCDKIFEPFFTTKDLGKGTGLGLATVYGIVKQNNGFIHVYSEPGNGTTFKIYLPPHHGAADRIESKFSEKIPEGHGELVLLVEDDPTIMKVGQIILEKLGYRVFTANTPDDALDLAERHTGEIDLLITDVIMPGMNGRDLAERIHMRCPKIRILFMSGYTADVIAHHGVLDDGVNFIQKPFSKKDLAVKVREAMDQTDG